MKLTRKQGKIVVSRGVMPSKTSPRPAGGARRGLPPGLASYLAKKKAGQGAPPPSAPMATSF